MAKGNPRIESELAPSRLGISDPAHALSQEVDWKEVKRIIASASSEQAKGDLLCFVVNALVGEMKEKEIPLFDTEGLLFAFLLAPGYRESLCMLDNPKRREALEQTRAGSFVPADEIRTQLQKKFAQT